MMSYKEINEKVNRLAMEMISHAPSEQNAPKVMELREKIITLLFGIYMKNDINYDHFGYETRYYKLVETNVPDSVFVDVLMELTSVNSRTGQWYFSAKSSFVTFFIKKLRWKMIDFYEEKAKEHQLSVEGLVSIEEIHESKADSSIVFDKWIGFSYIIDRFIDVSEERAREEKTDNKKMKLARIFKSYFTFYTTKIIKTENELAEEALDHNDTLFPLLLILLLEFLMTGSFTHVSDIIINPLKDGIDLGDRVGTMKKYFGVSRATEIGYNKEYKRLRNGVLGW